MRRTGRRWLLAFPLALGLGLLVLPLAKGSVDSSLEGRARAALDAAGVAGVSVTSDWAGLRLSGPPSARDAALAAVARMEHRDAVARVAYAVPAALATPAPTVTPTQTPTQAPQPVDVVADLTVAVDGTTRTVRLAGTVAGQAQHAALLAAVTAWAPGATVDDGVTVADGVPSPASAAAWPHFLRLAGPTAGLTVADGVVHLDPEGLEVSGVTDTEASAALIIERADAARARGITIRNGVIGPVVQTQRRLAGIKGLTGVQFQAGSAALAPASLTSLDAVAAVLAALPDGVVVEIRGYTYDQADATANLQLSQARAAAVLKYLVGKGVPANRLQAKGFGAALPRGASRAAAARAVAARRIEFVVKGS